MTIFILQCIGWMAIVAVVAASAYRNGVRDGYQVHFDSTCPGYQKARRILEDNGIRRGK